MSDPADSRVDPPFVADERTMLTAWLDWHRGTLERKCAGLDEARLAERAVPPSSLSLLGLVRHLTEVERGWFRGFAGEDHSPLYYSEDDPDGDFDNVDGAETAEVFATWRAACEHSRAVVSSAASLDAVGVERSRGREVSLRWILVHLIEEYARHNGHADLLRERIDGATGD